MKSTSNICTEQGHFMREICLTCFVQIVNSWLYICKDKHNLLYQSQYVRHRACITLAIILLSSENAVSHKYVEANLEHLLKMLGKFRRQHFKTVCSLN